MKTLKIFPPATVITVIAIAILLFSCTSVIDSVGTSTIAKVGKNGCDMMVFKDSLEYSIVYDYLEYKKTAFDTTLSAATVDEDQPLVDFETTKSHYSYRKYIKDQEDAAEASGIDLSVSPIPEILDDDEILQTLLNKNRMLAIGNIVYYYYDDCTLFKFPMGKDCQKSADVALSYFAKYDDNLLNHIKPSFTYEKVDICDDEINFKMMSQCQEIAIDGCSPDPCHPEEVDFVMYFPTYYQGPYTLTDFKYSINGAADIIVDIATASSVHVNACGLLTTAYGFDVHNSFPAGTGTYNIKMNGKFTYVDADGHSQTCDQEVIKEWTVTGPCSINASAAVTGFLVSVEGADNPCTAGPDVFDFTPLDGSPTIGYQTGNSIKLKYSCEGDKHLKVHYNFGGCESTKILTYHTVDPSLCCKKSIRTHCTQQYTLGGGNYRINTKLKERSNRLVGIIRNFKKVGSKFKRTRTQIIAHIVGPLYFTQDACDCKGMFTDFTEYKNARNKSKTRIKFKLLTKKSSIESATGMTFATFKKNWSRKNTNPWKLNVNTTEITADQTFKIDCPNTSHICN